MKTNVYIYIQVSYDTYKTLSESTCNSLLSQYSWLQSSSLKLKRSVYTISWTKVEALM